MAYIILPSRRTRQPQGPVRVSSAYSGNAVVCYNFADRSARSVGKNPQLWTTITNFSFGVRAGLSGLVCDGTGNYLESVESFLPVGSSPRTVIQVVNITTSGSSASPLYNWGSATDGQAFGVNLNNGAQTIGVWVWGSGDKSFSDTSIAAGRQNNIVATHANGNTSVWNSGKALGTQAQTINTVSSGYQRLNKLPAFYDVAHHYFIGVQSLVAVLDREVSSAEGLELSINPWQLFAPDSRKLYFAPSGGGANIFESTFADSWSLSDTYSTSATLVSTYADSPTVTDSSSSSAVFSSAFDETVPVSDGPSADMGGVANRTQEESFTITDAYSASMVATATISETLSAEASLDASAIFNATFAETLPIVDGEEADAGRISDIAETVAVTDAYTAGIVAQVTQAESVTTIDTYDTIAIYNPLLAETLPITDTVGATLTVPTSGTVDLSQESIDSLAHEIMVQLTSTPVRKL